MGITINDVRDFIKAKNLKPTDLFSSEALIKDPMVEAEGKRRTIGEVKHTQRHKKGHKKTMEKLLKAHEKEIKERTELLDKLRAERRELRNGKKEAKHG